MPQDSMFTIGSTHKICQDYATYGNVGPISYGIVCDGCSSSKDVDIGARLLALTTRNVLNKFSTIQLAGYVFNDSLITLLELIIKELSEIESIFKISNSSMLDATLLFYLAFGNKVRVYCYGDGMIVYRDKENLETIKLEYSSGAPYYLSYENSVYRRGLYQDVHGKGEYSVTTNKILLSDRSIVSSVTNSFAYMKRSSFYYEISDKASISLFSDGINSFMKKDSEFSDSELLDMIIRYTNFPVVNGEFVIRNFNFNSKYLIKNSFSHYDDLSCATFVGENNDK